MAEYGYLVTFLLTGAILVALVITFARARQWRTSSTAISTASGKHVDHDVATRITRIARTPLAWTVGFLVLAVTVGATTVAFVAEGMPTAISRGAGVAIAIVLASALGTYFLWGIYHSARHRDLSDAQATLVSLWVIGLLFIVAVVLNLVMAG
jgi:hypothetical protein